MTPTDVDARTPVSDRSGHRRRNVIAGVAWRDTLAAGAVAYPLRFMSLVTSGLTGQRPVT